MYVIFYPMCYALCRRPLTIAHCCRLQKTFSFLYTDLAFLVSKLAIWYAWCLHFGALGYPRTILGLRTPRIGSKDPGSVVTRAGEATNLPPTRMVPRSGATPETP